MFYEIHFHGMNVEDRTPYVRDGETVEYVCDGKQGTIAFDGYFYVENGPPPYNDSAPLYERYEEWLPKKAFMFVTYREKDPYKTEAVDGWTHLYYREFEKYAYIIEIYKKEVYESTDEMSNIEDGDSGEMMDVCFFPTNRLKIWFRVLEVLEEKGADELGGINQT